MGYEKNLKISRYVHTYIYIAESIEQNTLNV